MISEKEAAQRRRKIKISAYQLFQEKGVDNVTFGDIAALSGICERSVYHYFPQKSYLILEIHKYLWRNLALELSQHTSSIPTFREACGYQQIDYLIEAFQQIHLSHPEYLKFALECKLYWIRKKYVLSHGEYDNIIAPVMQQFADALKKGVEDNSVYLRSDLDSCCFLLWGILRSYVEQMVISDALFSDENRLHDYFQVLKVHLLRSFQA